MLGRNVENRTLSDGHTMQKLVPETLGHLSPSHMDYFLHWCLLLDLENKSGQKSGGLKEIWCLTGPERYWLWYWVIFFLLIYVVLNLLFLNVIHLCSAWERACYNWLVECWIRKADELWHIVWNKLKKKRLKLNNLIQFVSCQHVMFLCDFKKRWEDGKFRLYLQNLVLRLVGFFSWKNGLILLFTENN